MIGEVQKIINPDYIKIAILIPRERAISGH
jgi:hypothetical protein